VLAAGARPARRLPRPPAAAVVAAIPALLIVGLLVTILVMSVRVSTHDGHLTLDHYRRVWADPFAYRALVNTFGYAFFALVTALAVGVPIAWLTERTDLPGKSIVWALMFLAILIPGFFTAMGWVFMFHPTIGVVNGWIRDLLGPDAPILNVASIPGMGITAGLNLAVIVFVLTSASLRAMDVSLEEAAAVSGAGLRARMQRITLPLAWPGVFAAMLFVVTAAISAVDGPLLIGLPNRIYVFSTYLIQQSTTPGSGEARHGVIAAFSTFMIVLAIALTAAYSRILARSHRFEVVAGRGYRRSLVRLGRGTVPAWLFIGAYFALLKLLPLLLAVWTSLVPYFQAPSLDALGHVSLDNWRDLPWDLVRRTATTTLILTVVAPTICIVLALVFSWAIVRGRGPARYALDATAFLPTAVPGLIFAYSARLAVLYFVHLPFGIELYGSLALLAIVFAIGSLGFATRLLNSSLVQIHRDLDDSARVAGASTSQVVRRVTLPLIRPTVAVGWLFMALLVFRDLSLPMLLGSADTMTLSMTIWTEWDQSEFGSAAALNLIMLVALLPLIAVYWKLTRGGRVQLV
jgi:iron(III) transport system permease protein